MFRIDLNSDLGESFGAYTIGKDSEIIPLISSANIACGFHAGDSSVMKKTVELCKENAVAIGAHPGYPDLLGFGRRGMNVSPADVKAMITYQVGALDAFCRSSSLSLQHVKPHGALYNAAGKDMKLAEAICEAIFKFDPSLILMGLSGSCMAKAAANIGLPFASEVFADRAYEEDGSLVARTKPGAMITDEDEAVSRVITMIKEHKVKTITGKEIELEPQSVCVHGDSDKALAFVKKIRSALESEGIIIEKLK